VGADSLPRRVLIGLFSTQPTAVRVAGVGVHGYTQHSMARRVVAGLISLHPAVSPVSHTVDSHVDTAGRSNRDSIEGTGAPDSEPLAEVVDFGEFVARRRSAKPIPEAEAALAAADEGLWQPHSTPIEDLGLVLIRMLTESDETLFAIESQPGEVAEDGDVVYVRFRDERQDRHRDLLIPLARNESGVLVGDVVIPGNHVLVAVEPLSLLTVTEIPAQLSAAVSESVRLSSAVGRNAWRGLVRELPSDHRIRHAVQTALP
jgi:hypothetical protein